MATEPSAGTHAVVSTGGHRALLRPGDELTFGRDPASRLRIEHAPEDLRVPRVAGRLECRRDGVLIHSLSDERPSPSRPSPARASPSSP